VICSVTVRLKVMTKYQAGGMKYRHGKLMENK